MSRSPSLSVVVVTYRRRDLLLDCLQSVSRAIVRIDEPTELVVVDNGSPERTGDLVRDRFPGAFVIDIACNDGFTAAAGAAFRRARGEWIVLLNDDVTVEPDALAVLLETGRRAANV